LKALSKKREDRFENCKTFVRAIATKPLVKDAAPVVAVHLPADDDKEKKRQPQAEMVSKISTVKLVGIGSLIATTIVLSAVLLGELLTYYIIKGSIHERETVFPAHRSECERRVGQHSA